MIFSKKKPHHFYDVALKIFDMTLCPPTWTVCYWICRYVDWIVAHSCGKPSSRTWKRTPPSTKSISAFHHFRLLVFTDTVIAKDVIDDVTNRNDRI